MLRKKIKQQTKPVLEIKLQSTIRPDTPVSFNNWAQHVHNELYNIYNNKNKIGLSK